MVTLYQGFVIVRGSEWEGRVTDQFEGWWMGLTEKEQESIVAAVEFVQERGPALGRPFVDGIKSSRHPNMKELIAPSGYLRVLFAFDPRRMAILLIGGDKRHRWDAFDEEIVPVADDLYDEHLAQLRAEGWNR